MTYRISKTILEQASLGDFAARAAVFAVEMKAWRAHMARVREDEANDVTGIEKHMAYHRPNEHELVKAAVNENDEVAYQIVDDGPSAEDILRTRKNALLDQVTMAEQSAINRISPSGRRRLFNLRDSDIQQADLKRGQKIMESRNGLLAKATKFVEMAPKIDIEAEIAKGRSPEDQKHLEEHAERNRKIDAIVRAAAEALHDVEDLTAENIDSWSIPDFGEK